MCFMVQTRDRSNGLGKEKPWGDWDLRILYRMLWLGLKRVIFCELIEGLLIPANHTRRQTTTSTHDKLACIVASFGGIGCLLIPPQLITSRLSCSWETQYRNMHIGRGRGRNRNKGKWLGEGGTGSSIYITGWLAGVQAPRHFQDWRRV